MVTMKYDKKQLVALMRITTFFGYGLFLLTVISITLTTIVPMITLLVRPDVMHANVLVFLIVIVVSGLLPSLASYLLGDKATHGKNKLVHHYNGVLFAVAAYWVYLFISFIDISLRFHEIGNLPVTVMMLIGNWPVLGTLIAMIVLAVMYARSRKRQETLLHYRPFQLFTLVSAAAFLVYISWMTVQSTLLTTNEDAGLLLGLSLGSLVPPLLLTALSYRILSLRLPDTRLATLTLSVVAMTIGGAASALIGVATSYVFVSNITVVTVVPWIGGALVWFAYIWFITRRKN